MLKTTLNSEVSVIGAGIAGCSVAYELARRGVKVCIAEREASAGYHTTGRSAATFVGCYGNNLIRAISAASFPFFIAGKNQLKDLDKFIREPSTAGLLEPLDLFETKRMVPALRTSAMAGAALEPQAKDIDVNSLLMGYLRGVRNKGGILVTGAEVVSIERQGKLWVVKTRAGDISTPTIVNAAGAWGDKIGEIAGTRHVGLIPKRRTALTIDPDQPFANWPLTISMDESWYFRPEGGYLLISPADETPSFPCDSQPEEMDIAQCIEQIQRATHMKVERIISKRAGLRTFVPDKFPICGYADDLEGFFWLVGQGGYGIQTAPALANIAVDLIFGTGIRGNLEKVGGVAAALSPAR